MWVNCGLDPMEISSIETVNTHAMSRFWSLYVSPQTGSEIFNLLCTGNENRKLKFWLVILGFLTWKITSTSQIDAIMCRFRIINTLGSGEPARIVGG